MVRNKRGGEKGRGVGVREQTWKNICVLLTSLVLFIIAEHLFSSHWAITEFLDIKQLKYWKCAGFFWFQCILLCLYCSSAFLATLRARSFLSLTPWLFLQITWQLMISYLWSNILPVWSSVRCVFNILFSTEEALGNQYVTVLLGWNNSI